MAEFSSKVKTRKTAESKAIPWPQMGVGITAGRPLSDTAAFVRPVDNRLGVGGGGGGVTASNGRPGQRRIESVKEARSGGMQPAEVKVRAGVGSLCWQVVGCLHTDPESSYGGLSSTHFWCFHFTVNLPAEQFNWYQVRKIWHVSRGEEANMYYWEGILFACKNMK